MNPDRLEVEIKSELDERTFAAIRRSFSPLGITTRKQTNHFFDTDNKKLLASKWVMRLRNEDERWFLTLKGKAIVDGSVHTRPEFEDAVSPQLASVMFHGFSPSDFQFASCRKAKELFGDVMLIPFLNFFNERSEVPWKEHTLELDMTTICGQVFYELEAETDPNHAGLLEREIRQLFRENGWRFSPSSASKFKRALKIYGIDASD